MSTKEDVDRDDIGVIDGMAVVTTRDFGYEGARVTWRVSRVEWIHGVEGRSATCYMTGAPE